MIDYLIERSYFLWMVTEREEEENRTTIILFILSQHVTSTITKLLRDYFRPRKGIMYSNNLSGTVHVWQNVRPTSLLTLCTSTYKPVKCKTNYSPAG